MNLLITGGSGYVGTRLINFFLEQKKIKIFNYDLALYGDDHLPKNENLVNIKKDIRDAKSFKDVLIENKIDTVLHLACISNDPSFDLNPVLSKEVNYVCFENLVKLSKRNGVKKFIYASTSSVYGVSDSPNVDEKHPLKAITDYNKFKAMCEPILLDEINNDFLGIVIRPATVCGFSEKMRFDLSVNILTNFAYHKGYINVFGGEQYRPNIHINDMIRLYEYLIFEDISKFNGETFNAGLQNLKIKEIAKIVKEVVEKKTSKIIDIRTTKSDDIRSYRINSDKIQKILNFEFKHTIKDAVVDICDRFSDGTIEDSFNEKFLNIKVLLKSNLVT